MEPPKVHSQQPQTLQNTNVEEITDSPISSPSPSPAETLEESGLTSIPDGLEEINDTGEAPAKKQKLIDSKEDPNPHLPFPHTDGALRVENQILYVAKSILTNASPVFKSMFESDFKEKNMEVIELPGKTVEDMVLFLKCIYPFITEPVTAQNVLRILPLAHEYMTKSILLECEKVISDHCNRNLKHLTEKYSRQTISLDTILSYLSACEEFSLQENILDTVAKLASFMDFSIMKNHEDYECLSDETKSLITTKRLEEFEGFYRVLSGKQKGCRCCATFGPLFRLKENPDISVFL